MEEFIQRSRTDAQERLSGLTTSLQETVHRMSIAADRERVRAEAVVRQMAEQVTPLAEASTDHVAAATIRRAEQASQRVETMVRHMSEQVVPVAQSSANHMAAVAWKGAEQASQRAGIVALTLESLRTNFGAAMAVSDTPVLRPELHRNVVDDVSVALRTTPPIRLRMMSHDHLAHVSMELQWGNGTGVRQEWTSYQDPLCGWFDAEKVLPSSVTDLRVSFSVHTPIQTKVLKKVDRANGCVWVNEDSGEPAIEEFWFHRRASGEAGVDVSFELRGSPDECHVACAWNSAARINSSDENATEGDFETWEYWPNLDSRPSRRARPEVLQAADLAAPPPSAEAVAAMDPLEYCVGSTRRLVAAAKALQEVQRAYLVRLRHLDQQLLSQWVAVNSTNTVSASLAVASAAAFFVSPPLGVGLGLSSAATGGAASIGELLADSATLRQLRELLCEVDMSTFAVADLQQEWLHSRDHVGAAMKACNQHDKPLFATSAEDLQLYSANIAKFSLSLATTFMTVADDASVATAASAQTASVASRTVPMAAKALGVAGAVLSTGVAVHGWATVRSLQTMVKNKLTEINSWTLGTQRWLSAMSELECTICLASINLNDEVRCCKDSWHYSHARCLQQWEEECRVAGRRASCPLCCGSLCSQSGVLERLIADDLSKLLGETSV